MTRHRKKYSRDFKMGIIAQVGSGIKPSIRIARENGIHPSLITRWRSEHAKDPEHAFSGNGNTYKPEARIAELERMLGKAHAENDLLRKAIEQLTGRIQEERHKKN